jgi:hypothetical protein
MNDQKYNIVSNGVTGDRFFGRQLAVGSWQLAVGSWQLAVGSWQLAVKDVDHF